MRRVSVLGDLWPDEDRRNAALDRCAENVLHPQRSLTDAEILVLRLHSHGQTRPMIADQLCLSLAAIKSRTTNAREKLGAKTIAEACCEAIRRGLMP